MSRSSVIAVLCGVVALAAVPARADYLYDAIRAECLTEGPSSITYYSAAEPVIGTVPLEVSEVDRIGSNYLVYGGFRYHGRDEYRGHLYAVRLFKETIPHSNDWEFTDTGATDLLSKASCERAGSPCLFDAGQMLYDRVSTSGSKARRIFTGNPDTSTTIAGSAGNFTLKFEGTHELDLTNGPSNLGTLWNEYVALAPILAGMPPCKESGAGITCECPGDSWWHAPQAAPAVPEFRVPTTLCKSSGSSLLADYPRLWRPEAAQRQKMVEWLHGKHRSWPLGDVYHASAAIVEPPGFEYKDRGYPEFRKKLADRPHMIYVGANDGMIHAFHATYDFQSLKRSPPETERWDPGEEAWAYLPVNMLARTLIAAESGKQRFFSQDLSCRFADMQVDTSFTTCTASDQAKDKYCGWRTVLICGQGWGGSWVVALDVTEPLSPKPLWEFTHVGDASNNYGIGRTWSLPSISLVARDHKPVWLAIFGNGMNSSMKPYAAGDATKPWYRNLNLPFKGSYASQGQGSKTDLGHAYVLNAATGQLMADLHDTEAAPNPMTADSTVLDFDNDGLVDAGYMASYKGLNRIELNTADAWMCNLANFVDKGPLSGHPTAFAYKRSSAPYKVVLVTGAGIDSGDDPDEQANNGNQWGVLSRLVDERKDLSKGVCPTSATFCTLDDDFNGLNDGSRKARLLGAPLFTRRQRTGDNARPYDDLLIYTIWTAPHHNEKTQQCDTSKGLGNAHLLCMDVTLKDDTMVPRCEPCDGFEVEKKTDNTLIYRDEAQAPAPPVSADGRVYVTNPNGGIEMVGIIHDGNAPNANSNRPSTAVPARLISWREVYAP